MAAALLGGTVAGAIIFRSIYTVPMNMVLSDTPEFALTANGTDLTALDWGTFHYGEIKTISANIAYKTTGSFLGINRCVSPHGCAKLYFHNNPIEAIDIDTEDDFRLAEIILQKNLYDFGTPICA